tara:strand:- start:66 stop:1355 length:1290 start_codon:yes stop_codon:yes gene_type:complete
MSILKKKIRNKKLVVGIIGLGYVGLPLAKSFSFKNILTYGFDIDKRKVNALNKGKSYINYFSQNIIKKMLKLKFKAYSNFEKISEVDIIILCLPTPLKKNSKTPEMSYINDTFKSIKPFLRKNQLISLESTTYPGTCEDIFLPYLKKKFELGENFFMVYSPEREDPGNKKYNIHNVPKILGGSTKECRNVGEKVYSLICKKIIKVSSLRAAELVKILENVYRSVNISLVNELKLLAIKMKIDIFEIINSAKTKPFGYQAFYPGPGYGGHCIPIDPFLLSWKAKKLNFDTKFIKLSGQINTKITNFVIKNIIKNLENNFSKKILFLGAAYKKDIDDYRESPALKIFNFFIKKKIKFDFYDPFVKVIRSNREKLFIKRKNNYKNILKNYDLVVILTDHTMLDYSFIQKKSNKIIDTRGVYKIYKFSNVISC